VGAVDHPFGVRPACAKVIAVTSPRRRRRPIRSALLAAGALCALASLAGCGSSSPSRTTSKTSTTRTTSSSASSGIQVSTTPKYLKPSPSEPVRSGVVNIAYRDITIQPALLRVKVGTTLKWTNFDPFVHNVTSESGPQRFASGNFGKGGTFEVTLRKPGLIHYQCTTDPATMNGTIEVVG
jgi:plastocyanin